MKKYALVSTYYCFGCPTPLKENVKQQFNYDGDIEDLYVNFSDDFDPWHMDHLTVGESGRKDLVFGKIFRLKDFVKDNILGKYEYIAHIDFMDAKFARSFIGMMDEFVLSGEDFIISTEKNCWPIIEHVRSWVDFPLEEKEFEYINSGAIISKIELFYEFLEKLSNLCLTSPINFNDDQGVWQYYNVAISRLNADKECKYFFSTAHLDDSYYSIVDGNIKTKFDTYPYLIHDNSSFSLNLISKI